MKILFITDNFPPEVNAPATRTYEHCVEWVKQGAEVTVITGFPNFPQGKVYEGYKNMWKKTAWIDGIKVIRVWTYIAENKGFTKRILDYISFSITAFFAGLRCKTDVIIATSPQFFTTWTAFLLSKMKMKPWIFELRDLWPETIKTVKIMQGKKIIRFLEKIELALYRNADLVIPVTDAFKKNLISRGINENKIKVITNGVNAKLFFPQEKNAELSKKLGFENKFVVGYIGTMGMCHGLNFIVTAISKIKREDISFLFIGEGAMRKEAVALAKKLKLKNIIFLKSIKKEEVPIYLSICDISLVPLRKDDNFKAVIPSKIFESCAMKKPILLGVEGQAQEIIEKYNSGVCYEPENEKDFIEKLFLIKENVEFYNELKKGSEELAKNYDRTSLAKNMLKLIEKVDSY